MTVVSLAEAREARNPHWAGKAVCLGCRHEWVGVGPVGTVTDLECPSCNLPKGVTKSLFGADSGDSLFLCPCGSEAMNAFYRRGRFRFACMGCGTDHTNAIFGEAS